MYQYPTRPGAAPPPAAAQTTAFGQPAAQQPYVPPPPPVVAPGHPPNSVLFSYASGSVTTLRLKAAEAIRLQPPVPISSVLLAETASAQSLPQPDLSLERQVLGEAEAGGGGAGSAGTGSASGGTGGSGGGASAGGGKGASSSASTSSDVEAFLATIQAGSLPRDPAVAMLSADKGASGQAALLGLAYARGGRGGTEKAGDFASKLDQLTGMGFPLAMAAGALAKHGNDVEAATESCLAIAM
ncbi:hypothetical protein CHLRE_12g490600v5 [Chlamydomonas reinhardtii]|uniref:Uncharacterized protein n=1 Tax=Chlamydomonas reinhardtii TaxID=3055 RepID=A8ILP7_CHLRE|nr:uncharacterized protein CHLRE_12g490600v5 [Chlamydomonas reinhardtii]PNW74607.1 hypothetical protein CHLRE_12g490600v5 [Chlamydomonas reinhardtii]|eukprot:XP_001691123.1 predicted protein [Chlamydomonas reinhardtii]